MSILVTGGAGFIGSHLCERLLEDGRVVVCIDNFDPYYDPPMKKRNLSDCLSDQNFELVEGDIRNGDELEEIFETHEVEKIVHLAARPGVRSSVEDPSPYEEINIGGTLNLLELAQEHDVEKFVFGSSSSVYGEIEEVPFREDGPTNPISPYATSKLAGETYCRTYSVLHDLDVTVLRFFTVYGPRQRPEMAIHKFTRLVENGEEVPMYGDGTSMRDYTYIEDAISGTMSALKENFDFEVFNIGNSRTVELRKLISIVEEKVGKEARIDRLPMQEGDMPITYADISKAKELLDYDPKISIDEGVEKFVEWYRKNMADGAW